MTCDHNFIPQTYTSGGGIRHHLSQCTRCGCTPLEIYRAACEAIARTRDDPQATEIMVREGWALLGAVISAKESGRE